MNKAADVCTQVSVWTHISFLLVNSRVESAGLYVNCMFNFIRNSTKIRMRVLTALHPGCRQKDISRSSRCVVGVFAALIFISLMTNDFESIFHVFICWSPYLSKILALQKRLYLEEPARSACLLRPVTQCCSFRRCFGRETQRLRPQVQIRNESQPIPCCTKSDYLWEQR